MSELLKKKSDKQTQKQEAIGPHRSTEKTNTYDYIITLIKRRKKKQYLLFENRMILHLHKLESSSPKDALC